jgi:hypothetical protein
MIFRVTMMGSGRRDLQSGAAGRRPVLREESSAVTTEWANNDYRP